MFKNTTQLIFHSRQSILRSPLKTDLLLSRAPLARVALLSAYQSLIKRESSSVADASTKKCCSKSSNVSSISDSTSTDEKKSPSCHTTSATTIHHGSHPKPKSQTPISSLAFWSDPKVWSTASVNTFRCLVGCTVGDMSMLFYLQSAHPTLSPAIAMGFAMTSGIVTSISLETVLLRFSKASNMSWKDSFRTATGMSLISMLTMEAVENAVDYHLMGWGNVDFTNPIFWRAIGLSALAGWSAPLPFNYWNLKRHGKSCH